ncbi:hypothetical protein NU08_2495 [Flavobacterium anhuiense]|uniref:Lipoprotein n=1 Tax=Flavobacterium anhuiense TaxID=459526 RepID=A0A444VYE1_9FLAO|nr:hypothetical protein [Flavobacterium anhuiense]RYJ38518.1 hypothetical protein NU08_2495 [Flavobacterium anhuiense]
MIKNEKSKLTKLGILIFVLIYGCAKKKEENIQNENKINKETMLYNDNNDKIKSILIKQVDSGSDEVYGSFQDYNKDDLDALVIVAQSILKSSGYKIVDNKNFNDIVKKVFGRIIDDHSINEYLKIETFAENKCDKSLQYYPYAADAQYLYVVKGKFITNFYPLPTIIDYLKLFPDVSKFEKEDIIIEDKIENVKTKASQWKDDLQYLAQTREKNIQILINRNKYLFNDNKASLVWLKFNDQVFLESLVKIFGYVQDKDLLKWVLDRNLNDDEFDKLLFTKTCDNKYIFHKEIFEVMTKADTKSKEKYLLYLRGKTELPKVEDTSFSDTARIYGLYCYYATKFTQSIDKGYVYTFFPKLNDEKFEEEFKRSNYYNIPDFKKLFDDTKNGGIGLPM